MAEKHTETMSSRAQSAAIEERAPWRDVPFELAHRLTDEIDHLFDEFGLAERISTRLGRKPRRMLPAMRPGRADLAIWTPDVDMFQHGHDLVLRIDLPGMKKDDLSVHITDDAVVVRGERREEYNVDEGLYRKERRYGTIDRYISLPDGAMTEHAKATFHDGVLEIVMPAPPEHVTRGRRLEISERVDKH